MATDNEIARFLCERVVRPYHALMPYMCDTANGGCCHIDFTTWDGFGLLLTALAKAGRAPSIEGYGDLWEVVLFEEYHTPHKVTRDSPQRALMLAAAKAYGWKEGV